MPTSFDTIYSKNNAIMTELKLINKPDNLYYFFLSNYLEFSIAEFSRFCTRIDLLDFTPFSQNIYTFENTSDEVFVLSPTPTSLENIYVSVDNVKLDESDYSYNTLTHTLTISGTLTNTYVYVGFYNIGKFNVDLNLKEISILADAMTAWFDESKVNTSVQLDQVMYQGVELFSQAQHNKTNLAIEQFRRSSVYGQMINYNYSKNNMDSYFNLAKKAGVLY